jgi:hypothetical protein
MAWGFSFGLISWVKGLKVDWDRCPLILNLLAFRAHWRPVAASTLGATIDFLADRLRAAFKAQHNMPRVRAQVSPAILFTVSPGAVRMVSAERIEASNLLIKSRLSSNILIHGFQSKNQ